MIKYHKLKFDFYSHWASLPSQAAVVEALLPSEDDVQSPPQVVRLQCHDLKQCSKSNN